MNVARVKGTRDLLPAESARFWEVEKLARDVFGSYGYGEIRTPVLESTDLFARSVGESTDIVHKEMFTFVDRGGRSVTMRPENTAGVVRAVIENRLDQGPMPLRLYYAGPQYRYERPQKGRYREFRQIGAELLGAPGPAADAELLEMLFAFLRRLGFVNLSVRLNAVPTGDGRQRYSEALRSFASRFESQLGDDDRRRLVTNPLRLFDSKDPETTRFLTGAPTTLEFLGEDSAAHHAEVKRLLERSRIEFVEDPGLVRGLDYYTKTVFEVRSGDLGAQDAILGGGRYDELVSDLGGPKLAAVGFAIGEDRLIDVAPEVPSNRVRRVRVVAMSGGEHGYALEVAGAIRKNGAGVVDLDLSGRALKKALAAASEQGFDEVAIVGPDEARDRTVTLKTLASRDQRTVPIAELS